MPLDDVVIMPLSVGPVTGPGLDDMGPMYGMGGPSASALSPTELPEGKISSEDAQRAGRFAYADATVKPDRDYLYKVQLVAKNPRFEPTSPQDVPQFVESDLDATPLSLAQRALPSIRWFFIGGGEGAGQVRVYKWHVFTIPVSEMGEKLTDTEAASGQATVERADWVGVTFPVVRPGDVIGREEKRWFTARGTSVRQQLTIDFSTGATAVAVENAPRIEYAAAGDAATSRVVSSKLLLYYTDAEGALQTRWQETDLVPSERQVLLAGEAGAATGGPLEAGPVEGTGGQEGGYVSPERAASYRRMAEEAARRGEERFRAAQQEDEAMRRRMEREARRRSGGGY